MKPLLSFFALLLSLICCGQNETALIKKIKDKLDKVNDYKAKGKMVIDVSFINVPASEVTVFYKKPDQFKIKKSDGISLLPKGGVSININSLLAEKNYTIVPAGSAQIDKNQLKIVKLLPLVAISDIILTTLFIDEKNLVIKRAIVSTKDNGTYTIDLGYGKYLQEGLPDKVVFQFNTKEYKIPKGVTFEYEKGNNKKGAALKDNDLGKVEISYSSYEINKGIDSNLFNH
ncbi:MAG: hypothetical protein NVS1B13_04420 [Flavisolibacter sp.]